MMISPDFQSSYPTPGLSVLGHLYNKSTGVVRRRSGSPSTSFQKEDATGSRSGNESGLPLPSILKTASVSYDDAKIIIHEEQQLSMLKGAKSTDEPSAKSVTFANPSLTRIRYIENDNGSLVTGNHESFQEPVTQTAVLEDNHADLVDTEKVQMDKLMKNFDAEIAQIRVSLEEEQTKGKEAFNTKDFLVEACVPEMRQQLIGIHTALARRKKIKSKNKEKK